MNAPKDQLPLGYTRLRPGLIASVVTYLEMTEQPTRPERLASELELRLERLDADALDAYRDLFDRVGTQWLWCSRLVMSDEQLGAILGDAKVEAFRVKEGSEPVGLLELDFRHAGECELAFFGLVEGAIGRGLGRQLMNIAVRRAWSKPIGRFFVHTCTLDHPRALAFYQRSGFKPYALAVEVLEDPRLQGLVPRDAAPRIPMIAPS